MHPFGERIRAVPMIMVMGTIFFLSNQRGDTIDLGGLPGLDKVAHVTIYAALAATVIFAYRQPYKKKFPLQVCCTAIVVCLLYGISDEFHQSFVPGRFVSGADVLADVIGAALASAFWLAREKRRKKKDKPVGTVRPV